MKKGQNLSQAATIMLLSTVLVKLIGALFKIPLSADYCLGDLGFGYFSSAYDLYVPIYTLAVSGFPVAIARVVAGLAAKEKYGEIEKTYRVSNRLLLLVGLGGSLLALALAFPMVYLTGGSSRLIGSLVFMAPSLFFSCATSVYRGYFEGLKNMIPTAVSGIIESMGKLVLGLTFAFLTVRITGNPAWGAAAAMLGITAGSLASYLYLLFVFQNEHRLAPQEIGFVPGERAKIRSELIRFSVPVAITSLFVCMTSLVDLFTLRNGLSALIAKDPANRSLLLQGTVYSAGLTEDIPTLLYGIRSKANTLFNLVPTFATAFGIGALPLITESFVKKDKPALAENTNLLLKLTSVMAFPVAAGFLFLGRDIVALLYGKASAELGGRLLMIYGVATLFAGLAVPLTAMLQAGERQNTALRNILIGVGVKLGCNLLLIRIPALNVYGAAIGTAVCYFVIYVLHFAAMIRTFGFHPDMAGGFIKPLFAALICGITAMLLSFVGTGRLITLLAILAAGTVYFAVLFVIKALKWEEIDKFLWFFKKSE